MMSELPIVRRLREFAPFLVPTSGWTVEERALPNEAASLITELVAALEPFARLADSFIPGRDWREEDGVTPHRIYLKDLRRARAAIEKALK
jgi:hypothetical protein